MTLSTTSPGDERLPHADSVQQPSDEQALLGWTRYEKARKLNPAQWAELHQRNLRGETFDDMIDALPATTQPVQQDTIYTCAACIWRGTFGGLPRTGNQWVCPVCDTVNATPPAEKQAAPSGEDNHG